MNVTISNSYLFAQINSIGAELFSLQNIKNNQEYIWEGDPKYWGKHSPVLFPIVGTLKNNIYSYKNKEYKLPQHGLARNLDFEVIESSDCHVLFSLKATEETKKVYPFEFELQLTYTLSENKIEIKYTIINKDSVAIPFCIGGHPGFSLPKNFENYALEFEVHETLTSYVLENGLVSDTKFQINLEEKKLPLHYSTFENDALIMKALQSKEIIILDENKPLLKVNFKDFNNLGIWTKVGASF
ncbi:aldose 1-epimerase family protein, partial [Flavobacterium sp.]|uniref:aldose 1-epimerase family protein n=1 Tax=Flavobacterium sp. TaxID=239 RepID=UPI003BBF14EB